MSVRLLESAMGIAVGFLVLTCVPHMLADEATSIKVRVALALADAQSDGGGGVASGEDAIKIDLLAGHKPSVVMWVGGVKPTDHPEIAKGLADTKAVCVPSLNGNVAPRLVILLKNGSASSFSAESLKPSLLPVIRAELPKRIVWDF